MLCLHSGVVVISTVMRHKLELRIIFKSKELSTRMVASLTECPFQVIAALVGDRSPVADGLDWVRGWAAEVAEKDPDEACREVGAASARVAF